MKDVLCAGKESTFQFVEDVLTEVISLFPSKYIHIGGDESPRDRWKECPLCQQRIKDEGLANEHELQSYFMHRVEKWLSEHGRRIIGWDEIIKGGINKSATIMLWNDSQRQKATTLGNDVILSPKYFCYFDYFQTTRPYVNREGTLFKDRILTLRKAYSLNPYENLKPEEYKHIKGVQANLWTEYISTFDKAQVKLLPRLAATCEAAWTSVEKKDFNDFARRLEYMRKLYDKSGYKYATYFFDGVDEQ